MSDFYGVLTGIISSLVVVGISWGKFSTRIDNLEMRVSEAVNEQKQLTNSLFDLKIEITKLTGEIKELRNYYAKH